MSRASRSNRARDAARRASSSLIATVAAEPAIARALDPAHAAARELAADDVVRRIDDRELRIVARVGRQRRARWPDPRQRRRGAGLYEDATSVSSFADSPGTVSSFASLTRSSLAEALPIRHDCEVLTHTEYRLKKSELAQRYFTCTHCGAQGEVIFGAEGSSGWQRDSLFEPDIDAKIARAAENDLRTDASRTQALIACPTCGRRAPGAVRWIGIRIGAWLLMGLPFLAMGGQYVMATGFGGAGARPGVARARAVPAANRAVVTKLVAGKLPEPERPKAPVVRRQLAPPPDLPVARVVVAPAPIVHDEPPDPTAPPRFLKP